MKSLFSRLLLSVSVTVFILIIALWQWFQFSQDFSRNQIQQSLHSELALHMAHINPLLSQGATSDKALKEAFHDFMLLGPSFEIYTLDITGKVIAYDANEDKIKRTRIATAPIEQFISGAELPILGMDPRSTNTNKIFSVAPLIDGSGTQTGYLYVIIGGENFDMWQSLVNRHQAPLAWGAIIVGAFLFSLILFVLLLKYFTAPFSRLERDLSGVEIKSLNKNLSLPNDYRGSIEIEQLSHHIDRLLAKVSQQFQAINQQQQARQDFMQHLSHDLKTPLTSLQGYIDTWLLTPPNERSGELIEIAAKSGKQLQQLLGQMLELSALENRQIIPAFKTTDLNGLLDEISQTFTPRAQVQNIQLNFGVNDGASVYTDPHLLMRVLSNLVDNAIRYTPKGGEISITPASPPQSKAFQETDSLWLCVADNGAGIHQHELQALLEMRNKPKFKRDEVLPQLGVGLAIVRQLLSLLDCRIDIMSTPGEGSQFYIALPIKSQ